MQRTVQILSDLIGIDSTFGREAAIGSYVRSLFEGRGFHISEQEVPGGRATAPGARRVNLIVERGEPRLCFFGHLDTVCPTAAQLRRWQHGPFAAAQEDGRMYGLGAVDMKAGIAAFVATVLALEPQHVGIYLTCDEEGKFAGVETLVRSELFGERTPALALFAEPTDLAIVNTHRGCVEIALEARGKAAHAAMPQLGVDASQLYLALQALRAELDRDFPGTHVNVGYFEAGHRDTINLVPERASAVVDIRPSAALQALGAESLATRIDRHAATHGLALTHDITIDMKPLDVAPIDLALLEQAVRAAGIEVRYADLLGTSEAGVVHHRFGFPCANFGPGPMAMAHRTDEYVDLELLRQCRAVFERLVGALGY
jgi:acetylornithine deacetylase/succinyl-diaminopimelate desuccinylase-like protein